MTFLVGFDMLLDYVSSKGGIVGFTRALAHEIGPDGIDGQRDRSGRLPDRRGEDPPRPARATTSGCSTSRCIKRRGTPEDIGNLVVFLSSDASSFITGQTVAIDGGWAMH